MIGTDRPVGHVLFSSPRSRPHATNSRAPLQSAPCKTISKSALSTSPRVPGTNASSAIRNLAASASAQQAEVDSQLPIENGPDDRAHETDYVVIGSGIGGLCCAALLARYGHSVTVVESHYLAGGAAHSFDIKGYQFDAGPSFFAGLSDQGPGAGLSSNPLKQTLDALGEKVECATYDRWVLYEPGASGPYPVVADGSAYRAMIAERGGMEALRQWEALEREMAPLQKGAALFPAAAIRSDPGILLTALRFGPELAMTGLMAGKLTGPFSNVVDKVVTHPWLRTFIDLECFVLSGMLAKDTITAEMAFMFMERNSGRSTIDYPMGGAKAIVDALLRGLTKHGGRLLLRSHVDRVLVEGGRAAGVVLRPRKTGDRAPVIRARKAVISNASVWDTAKLVPTGAVPASWQRECEQVSRCGSFMHLHLGIDAEELPEDLECHHLFVNSWADLEAPQNVCIASIPTVFDSSLAPPGKAVVHAYTAGNEPYEGVWEGLDRGSSEYRQAKEERSQCLWAALERVIPDVRDRAELTLVGTPLTHERFLRRYKGTYGAAISAATGAFPGPGTPLTGLYRCGDSCMPGIGVPAAAASGMITANTLTPVWSHFELLNALNI